MIKLSADRLREYNPSPEEIASIQRKPIYIICDNILDTYNIGAIFRLADAAAVSKVYLVGATAVPTDPLVGHKIHKASVGVWQWVSWKHVNSIADAIENIKSQISNVKDKHQKLNYNVAAPSDGAKLHVVAIEQSSKSIPYTQAEYQLPLVLILGHETDGVSREGLEIANQIVEIPMFGVNKSLNVMVSLSIILWKVLEKSSSGSS